MKKSQYRASVTPRSTTVPFLTLPELDVPASVVG